jgi:biopolymer transport protein ExbB
VGAAKNAVEDASLPETERLARQTEVARASLARLNDVIGGARFPGQAVDEKGALTKGEFAVVGPLAYFASRDGRAVGVALPQTGTVTAAVRSLEPAQNTAIAAVITDGKGSLPVDATRGAALKALIQRTSLIHIFQKGGPIMWPLLVVSILAFGTVMERLIFLANERRKRDSRGLATFLGEVERGNMRAALVEGRKSADFVVRALAYALEHRERSLPSAILYSSARELKRFSRGIPVLDTAITLSPLLGLLGTVTGMMGSFSLIGGDLSAPAAITGGIAEALIATAFGLGIAIVSLIPFNYLNNRVDEARHELDAAASQLELLAAAHPLSEEPLRSQTTDAPSRALAGVSA